MKRIVAPRYIIVPGKNNRAKNRAERNRHDTAWAQAAAVCMAAVILLLSGCYSKPSYTPPEMYPVVGKVISPSGKVPVGAVIKFSSADGLQTAHGKIAEDGSFALRTLFHEEWLSGAVEGPKSVQVLLPLGANRQGDQAILVNQTYTIEPKENNFTVTLE